MKKIDKLKENFSQIYDQYIEKIYRFIFIKVNSSEVAEDLCSETFIRFFEAFKLNQDKIENVQAFLYKIARNLVTDYYREKAKNQIVSADCLPIVDPNPGANLEEKALINSDLATIRTGLNNLKENYQNVIIWHYIDDFSIPEIAKMLDKSEGATRVLLHRAIKALKNELELGIPLENKENQVA